MENTATYLHGLPPATNVPKAKRRRGVAPQEQVKKMRAKTARSVSLRMKKVKLPVKRVLLEGMQSLAKVVRIQWQLHARNAT